MEVRHSSKSTCICIGVFTGAQTRHVVCRRTRNPRFLTQELVRTSGTEVRELTLIPCLLTPDGPIASGAFLWFKRRRELFLLTELSPIYVFSRWISWHSSLVVVRSACADITTITQSRILFNRSIDLHLGSFHFLRDDLSIVGHIIPLPLHFCFC